ncbi:MAG: bifunctional D-glycero-beta-D-manno-heptose-7-phosphate kinase/D-glycero-beta-D-manno-heptose 1-phosphate adenylyltransferase HldE [Gammaproteobacteria bacterium]|nr:MAG: bifunctional D-glycero-beta-D-manno-heptose-7-phosphate kinase/D-glycero-beta-D-manno-heptose 1-phosphate adenylyltransferase HldE [Gammaproteobacteria bacterium]
MPTSLPDFSKANILVAGDLMLDRYWNGDTQRISPEAPVPVVLVKDFEERPGGAGNVARSITALGGQCTLAGLLGEDEAAEHLEKLLQQEDVALHCIKDPLAKTVAKLRVLSRHQQLIRLDFEGEFSGDSVSKLTSRVCNEIERHNVLILSDYKKGALKDIAEIINKANSMGTSIFVDPKGGDFSKYKNVTAITPNQSEFTAVVGQVSSEQELVDKGLGLLSELNLNALIITRSEKGVMLIEKSGKTVNIPARAKEVFDVTGAGDTFISVLAASYAADSSFEDAVNIANAAASVVAGKLGAATVTRNEIEHELNRSSEILGKIIPQDDLIKKVKSLRGEGKKIVMTNGCFDILHSGHVEYLSKAKELGDVLIVAVNSDRSVNKIKGGSRPINKIKDRMTVLSSLQAVNWLVEFDQDTPEELIRAILPDVLVKGGDYKIEDIVGGESVTANGGEVKTIEYVQSRSTSELISKIKTS